MPVWLLGITFFPLGTPLRAQDAVDYLKEIKPILASKCFACHGALQQKGGLRLDTVASMLEGGNKGPALIAEQSQRSRIVDCVAGATACGACRLPATANPCRRCKSL